MQIPPDLTANFVNLDSLLLDSPWSGAIWNRLGISEFQSSSLSLFRFIEEHKAKKPEKITQGLLSLMHDAHGRGSGMEKGVLNHFAHSQTINIHLSTAFGTETNVIDLNNLHNECHYLYDFLQTHLKLLKKSIENSTFDWKAFRYSFISTIEGYFRRTVAETRQPLNDVSLFDQTAASVAFLKAALAQNLLLGWLTAATGEIEPLVGREWRSHNSTNRHAGQHVEKFCDPCWVPGSTVEQSQKFVIQHFGIWHLRS